jgi:hypothetical protein
MDSLKIFLVLGLVILISSGVSADSWPEEDLDKCREIQVSNPTASELQDFPVPVDIQKDSQMLDDYSDLRFRTGSCGSSGQELSFEFEERDQSSAEIWVKLNSLPSNGKTVSVYYDNKTQISSGEDASAVWNSGFRAVHHLEEEVQGDGGVFQDSTSNSVSGKTLNGVDTSVTGIFDGAYGFDGVDDALNFSDSFDYSDSDSFILMTWFNRSSPLDGDDRLLGFDVNSSWGLFFDGGRLDGGQDLVFGYNESVLASNISTSQEVFYSASVVYDGSGNAELFVNGTLVNSTSSADWENPVEDFGLGATGRNSFLSGSDLNFGGEVDEFRVSTSTRSNNWIQASHELLANDSAIQVGDEIEYVDAVIHSPSRRYIDNTSVRLEVSWENQSDSWVYNIDDGPNRTAGLTGVFYTNSTNHLRVFYENGTSINFSEQASVVGDQADLDSDNYLEVPYINTSGYLKAIDRTGETDVLDSGQGTSKEVIATGIWNHSEAYVFYADATDSDYLKRVRVGESPETIGSGIRSNGALGAADFNVDGDSELVFLGTSNTVKYLDDGAVKSTGFSSFGSNNQYGISQVADVDRDGQPRVAYVTGSNNLALLDYQGNKEKINSNYGLAAKTRISPVDWTGDTKKEILHIGTNSGEIKYQFYNGTTEFVEREGGGRVAAEESVGLASGKQIEINTTLENFSEGDHNINVYAYEDDIYAQESVDFTVDVSAPEFRNLGDNATSPFYSPDTANISSEVRDEYAGVNEVFLATNESGGFSNKSSYGSPEGFPNTSDEYLLSDFIWSNSSFYGELGYRLWAEDAAGNIGSSSTKSFEVSRIDLKAGKVSFGEENPVEGSDFNVSMEVQNFGSSAVTVEVNLTEETYNGSSWVYIDEKSMNVTFESDSTSLVNFSETAETGPRRYSFEVDSEDEVVEENESNNVNSSILNVPSNQVYYGDSENKVVLGSQRGLRSWSDEKPEGNIYYADTDASYNLQNLSALNGTDDLAEVDEALDLLGHNDSVRERYDPDGDGLADVTRCIEIAGSEVCDVPFANSTNSSNFQTGILYDAADGTGFDGSQDIVFTTNVTATVKQGLYGEYSYEAKVPSTLAKQKGGNDNFVDVRMEIG